MSSRNFYLILGVPETATLAEIRQAYRRLAKMHHPDHAGEPATARFQDIAEAYAVLSDARSRARHDAGLRGMARPSRGRPPAAEPFSRPARARAFVEPAFARSPTRASYGAGPSGLRSGPRDLTPLGLEILLSPLEARRGARISQAVLVPLACAFCRGAGALWNRVCPLCGGEGATATLRRETFELPPGLVDGDWLEYRIHDGGDGVPVTVLVRVTPER